MKIEQLRQMVELSKTHSMNRAAANLYMSQPNLSTSIRNLEEELVTTLVVRSSRGVTLTAQGERFVEYARSVLTQIDRLREACLSFERDDVPTFSLAMMRFRHTTAAAAQLYRSHAGTGINIKLEEMDRDGVIEAVDKGDSELGVIGILECYKKEILQQIKARELQYTCLARYHSSIVVGKGSPLYGLPEDTALTAQMLEGFPEARYDKMDYGHFADRRQRLELPTPPCEFVVSSRAALFELLETTDAYAVFATNHAAYQKTDNYPGARSFQLKDRTLTSELGWVSRRSAPLSSLSEEFIGILKSFF